MQQCKHLPDITPRSQKVIFSFLLILFQHKCIFLKVKYSFKSRHDFRSCRTKRCLIWIYMTIKEQHKLYHAFKTNFSFIVLGSAQNTILEAAEKSHKQDIPNYHCCHNFHFVKLYKNQSVTEITSLFQAKMEVEKHNFVMSLIWKYKWIP